MKLYKIKYAFIVAVGLKFPHTCSRTDATLLSGFGPAGSIS